MRLRVVSVVLVGICAVAGCTSTDRPSVQADEVALPTPMRSFDASVAAAVRAVEAAVAGAGEQLETPARAYRPSEPSSLLQVPRIIRRAALADPDDGWILIYEAADAGAALELADDLAAYLESGFGQTNYAPDTQFAASTLDDTLILTTLSRGRSDDPERAEAVFDAVASVGTPVEINK
jgi:hypothetical protein